MPPTLKIILRFTSALLCLAALTIPARASLTAYEPFNYATSIPTATPSTASGFTGNWTCGTTPSIAADLTYAALPTANGSFSSTSGRQSVAFTSPLSSGTKWISFLFNQAGNNGGNHCGIFFPNGGTGLFFGYGLNPQTASTGGLRPGSILTTGTTVQSVTSLASGYTGTYGATPYLVVMQIDFNTSGANDTVTIYINPTANSATPGVAATYTVTIFDVGTLTGIGFQNPGGGFAVKADEIRVGDIYSDVVGGVTAPVAPVITGVAPATGLTNGGTVVTISGSNFLAGVTVKFGTNVGTGISLNGSTNLSVTAPAGAPGAANLIVANASGLSATNVNGFTYLLPPPPEPPVRSSIVPGSVVTSGSNLSLVWLGATNTSSVLLTSTNLAPDATWTPMATNVFGSNGLSTNSLPVNPTEAKRFFGLSYPSPVLPDTGGLIPLFSALTPLEAPTTVVTPNALTTYIADRVRDRHAREGNFHLYDHYLSWYWEQRVANIQIIDRVGRNGGTDITFNYTTQERLNPAEFRTFFRGIGTVAEYNNNQIATLVSTNASATPGEIDYNYSATVNANAQFNRALQLGDRVEIEISQFLAAPRHGRNNYYGTVLLYIVGQGIVPWAEGQDVGFNGGIVGTVNQSLDSYPLSTNAWLGGLTTLPYQYSAEPEHRFKQTAGNISPTNGLPFMLGRRLHHTDFGDGVHSEPDNPVFNEHIGQLGPKFISRSCVECHINNGRALPAAIGTPLTKWVFKVGSNATGSPHPTLGSVLQPQSSSGPDEGSVMIASYTNTSGQYGDSTPYSLQKPNYTFTGTTPAFFSARIAPQLVGLGLLEAVSESTIQALADSNDANADGISGRIQTVTDPETSQQRLGRFGYKAVKARISHQVAGALNNDMGVATSVFPILDGETNASAIEITADDLDKMTRYVALLGVAARRDLTNAQALQGEQLFATASCVKCHTPTLTTSGYHPMAELRNQTIHPYTDLLLHDMGAGLADNMGEAVAAGSEWRTPPLWSIGLTAGVSGGEAYLHDGRARSLEEAILWHGGEAEASKESFRTMSAADRAALIKFLKSL